MKKKDYEDSFLIILKIEQVRVILGFELVIDNDFITISKNCFSEIFTKLGGSRVISEETTTDSKLLDFYTKKKNKQYKQIL